MADKHGVEKVPASPSRNESHERATLAVLASEIAITLTQGDSIPETLQRVSELMVHFLEAALVRIWILNRDGNVLELDASAGIYTHINGGHARVPVGQFKIGRIAQEGRPHLTNTVQQDSWVSDPAWAKREGMVAFAGYPLLVGDQVVGVVAAFARHSFSEAVYQAFGALAGSISQFVSRKRTEMALRESEERFRAMADGCPTPTWVTDAAGELCFVNRKCREFFGASYQQVAGPMWQPLLHAADAPNYIESFINAVKERRPFQAEARVRRQDGEWRWVASYAEPRWSPAGEFLGHVGLSPDITERKRAEDELRASEEKFRQLAENIREVFWMMNAEGTEVLYVSAAYEPIWGRTCEELYKDPMAWLEAIEPADREQAHATFLRQMEGEQIESEYRIRTPAGDMKWVRDRAFAIRNQAGEIIRVAGIAEDISARKKAEAELAHQARHDLLTGLPNRLLLSDCLEASLERAAKSGLMMAVLYVDLDGFKFVNDTLGHEAGDSLLQQVTDRLQSCVRQGDTLARMGGDEFMLVINDVSDDQTALAVAERLRAGLHKSFQIAEHEVYVTASIGIAMYPRDGNDASTLRCNADTAMYGAKRGGKDRVQLFSASMRDSFFEHWELATELRHALDRGDELSLAYQPIFETQSGRQTAFEALLRWTHPVLGPLSPTKFVPVAEESGLIFKLGAWVLQQACRQCRLWQDRGFGGVRVAVNVSALEFAQPQFAAGVLRILEETGLPGSLLDLEVTETALLHELDECIRKMSQLRATGVRISIDDFGTGYSSLRYLARLPVDTLKIDRSFVAELGFNHASSSLVAGIISLAHSIDKRVVVEGVETNEQLHILKRLDSDEVQGFLLGRPGALPAWDQAASAIAPSTEEGSLVSAPV